ncbi:hypothetical protein T03_9792 [Trichinella britovi]|uniref:Uncharacterized protein n=1 Tax=Trichinella britovi TaxID=45882 RepID=A0A0V1C4U9_TRIBR|nr:hypothetical protein T03_7624 [Trichinella britovi]KRY44313.1 hypothetical protein T03_9792 [Trichinella britovi]
MKELKESLSANSSDVFALNIRVGYRRRRFGGRDDVISKEVSKRD